MNVTIFSLEIESDGSFQKIYSYFTDLEMCIVREDSIGCDFVFVEYSSFLAFFLSAIDFGFT